MLILNYQKDTMTETKIIMPRSETVGKVATELWDKQLDTRNVQEIISASMSRAELAFDEAIKDGKKKWHGQSFFIVALSRDFRKLMYKTLMNQFVARQTCPTPNYDQHVWRYDFHSGQTEYIWSIPCKEACHYLKDNALLVAPEEKELLRYVLEYADGTLYKKCKKLNGEKETSNELERK